MQSATNDRIRVVMDTTQENLETALGRVMSNIASFYRLYIRPVFAYLILIFTSCWAWTSPGRRHRASGDIYFDMYDDRESESLDRGELERLLGDEDLEAGWSDSDSDIVDDDDDPGRTGLRSAKDQDNWIYKAWDSMKRSTKKGTNSWKGYWRRGKNPLLHYKPSTAGLRGVSLQQQQQQNEASQTAPLRYSAMGLVEDEPSSLTSDMAGKRKSVASSGSLRSLGDLLSEDDYSDAMMLEDAQLMSATAGFLDFTRTPSLNTVNTGSVSYKSDDLGSSPGDNYMLKHSTDRDKDTDKQEQHSHKAIERQLSEIKDEHRDRSNSAPPGLQRISSLISNVSLLSRKPKSIYESSSHT